MSEGFRTFDHTGDLGLEVCADSAERLYAAAAEALMAQIARPRSPAGAEPERSVDLALEGSDAADLLVHWLNTALLESELHHALWTRARVSHLEPTRLEGRLEGPVLDRGKHELLREVKAVSHHFLALSLGPDRFHCRLILDL